MFQLATKFSDITVKNCVEDMSKPSEHVIVVALARLLSLISGRNKMDLSELKVVGVDDADSFFNRWESEQEMKQVKGAI